MAYGIPDPLRPIPGHRIVTQEQAEAQAKALLDKVLPGRTRPPIAPPSDGAPTPAFLTATGPDDVKPLGYVVLTQQDDDTWKDDWDGEVHQTRQEVLVELERARKALGYHYACAAVLYPLEAP